MVLASHQSAKAANVARYADWSVSSSPHVWQSGHSRHSQRALARALKTRFYSGSVARQRTFTITTLGGSASAFRPTYADFLADLLERAAYAHGMRIALRTANPSHGYTGSDWAASYLDSLIPGDTDLLLWEFAINDWPGQGPLSTLNDPNSTWPGLRSKTWHAEAFELFVARAAALNTRRGSDQQIAFGFVFLWQPQAALCWPHCATCRVCPVGSCGNRSDGLSCEWRTGARAQLVSRFHGRDCESDRMLWRDNLAVLRRWTGEWTNDSFLKFGQQAHTAGPHADGNQDERGSDATVDGSSLEAFAVNVNSLLHDAMPGTAANDIFRDHHHPHAWVHEAIGAALMRRFVPLLTSAATGRGLGIVSSESTVSSSSASVSSSGLIPEKIIARRIHEPRSSRPRGQQTTRPLHRQPSMDASERPSAAFTLLSTLADDRSRIASYYYGDPRFGHAWLSPASEAARRTVQAGKILAERADKVKYVFIPLCTSPASLVISESGALRYTLTIKVQQQRHQASSPAEQPRYIGLNLRGERGAILLGALDRLDDALDVRLSLRAAGKAGEAASLTSLLHPLPRLMMDNVSVVSRGIFAPQAWYPAGPAFGDERSGRLGYRSDQDSSAHEENASEVLVTVAICRKAPIMSSAAALGPSDAMAVAATLGGIAVVIR